LANQKRLFENIAGINDEIYPDQEADVIQISLKVFGDDRVFSLEAFRADLFLESHGFLDHHRLDYNFYVFPFDSPILAELVTRL